MKYMGEKLFKRLKKLAEKRGEVILVNESGDDALVVMSLDRYEDLTDDIDSDFVPNMDFDFDDVEDFCDKGMSEVFKEENFEERPIDDEKPKENDKEDEELMKRVNEDIAKWREEQEAQKKEYEKEKNTEEKIIFTDKNEENSENDLNEEEKYYLEPLE